MSALPPIADIRQRIEHVCFVPLADIALEIDGCSRSEHRCILNGTIARRVGHIAPGLPEILEVRL